MNDSLPGVSRLQLITGTLLSGLAWYFAIDLSGSFGWLLWIAPLPLLLIAFQSTARQTFGCAFVAYLIGRLNWVPFLLKLMPVVPVVIITVLLTLLYALVILGTRRIVLARTNFITVLAYPVLLTAVEYVSLSLSYDGTAGSLAYTQSNYLPIIQIASVTGIWGILFFTALVPSTLALAWHLKANPRQRQFALLTGSLLIVAAMAFGWIRLSEEREHIAFPVGLTVVPENLHLFTDQPVFAKEAEVTRAYIKQILPLAGQGARVVVFPEKAINATESQKDSILALLQKVATDAHSSIAGGLTVVKPNAKQNLEEFISADGTVQEYKKNFHVKGLEEGFEKGEKVGLLQGLPNQAGMVICKDMDYPQWLRNYRDVDVLFVPAWDFDVDGWQHSRMAVMRGVENGFTIVRAARQGRLTISDYRGKVLHEVNCDKGQAASLLAQAPVYTVKTIYSAWGDWFGVLAMLAGLGWLVISRKKKN